MSGTMGPLSKHLCKPRKNNYRIRSKKFGFGVKIKPLNKCSKSLLCCHTSPNCMGPFISGGGSWEKLSEVLKYLTTENLRMWRPLLQIHALDDATLHTQKTFIFFLCYRNACFHNHCHFRANSCRCKSFNFTFRITRVCITCVIGTDFGITTHYILLSRPSRCVR